MFFGARRLVGKKALELGSGLDLCDPRNPSNACNKIATAASCCSACGSLPQQQQQQQPPDDLSHGAEHQHGQLPLFGAAQSRSHGVDEKACGAWFWNGNTTLCGGHGCCYLKRSAVPDKVTPPNQLFAAGVG
jgi:hypothetical protein